MKILSIIIPAYNMEAYLAKCIESILRTPSRSGIEIVIVNDGSKDKTRQIAKSYAERFVDTIKVIDKENGNYGSTINAALPIVEGEYVKILDADDTFNGSGVAELMNFVRKMGNVDMIVTPFVEIAKRKQRKVSYDLYSRKIYGEGNIYDADKIFGDGFIRYFMMHGICYRTQFLRDIDYKQSEGISYTDQEWVFYPLFKVKTIAFADIPLYNYNVAREGRTMDKKVQMHSIEQLVAVTENLARFFIKESASLESEARINFLRNVVVSRIKIIYRKYLLEMPEKFFAISNFEQVDALLSELLRECGVESLSVPVNNMLKVDLLAYWRAKGKRHNGVQRLLLIWADGLMSWGHGLIFRRKK